jgi:cell division transport system ATP-binding protein
MRLFERFNDVGVTLLIATHDLELIDRLDHRRLKLVAGRIVEDSKSSRQSGVA